MKVKICLIALVLVALGEPALGQTCGPVPDNLTNGTTADANQVMANFNYITNCFVNPVFTGNVGINTTTSPSANLQVFGSGAGILVGNTSSLGNGPGDGGEIQLSNYYSYMTLELNNGLNADPSDGSTGMYSTFGGGSSFPWSRYGALVFYARNDPTQGWIDFRTGSGSGLADSMVISPVGNVGIGTTAPAGPLNVYSPSAATSIYIGSTASGHTFSVLGTSADTNGYFFIQPVSVAGSTYGNTILNPTAGDVGIGTVSPSYALQVNGQVAGNGAYVNTSDARLKKNIRPLTNALALVERMQGVRFNWRTPTERTVGKNLKLPISEPQVGFIAQDLEKVLPEAVTTSRDTEGLKSVAESKVVPILVEAVKELKAENDRLRAQVDRQTTANDEMRRNDTAMRAELDKLERRFAASNARAETRKPRYLALRRTALSAGSESRAP